MSWPSRILISQAWLDLRSKITSTLNTLSLSREREITSRNKCTSVELKMQPPPPLLTSVALAVLATQSCAYSPSAALSLVHLRPCFRRSRSTSRCKLKLEAASKRLDENVDGVLYVSWSNIIIMCDHCCRLNTNTFGFNCQLDTKYQMNDTVHQLCSMFQFCSDCL